jgi:hypothetical protein
MNRQNSRNSNRAILRATGEPDEPKGPPRSVRLPASVDEIVESRVSESTPRASVIIDLIRKGLRYERLRQAKGDPALGELLSVMDEMLASRLSEAATQIYRHVFVESLILRKLLEEVLYDARVSSCAAERILAGKLFGATGIDRELDAFLAECAAEAESVVTEIQGEWQTEMSRALGITPDASTPPTEKQNLHPQARHDTASKPESSEPARHPGSTRIDMNR